MADNKLSQLGRFLERKDGMGFFIGMDVHKKSYHVAFRREDGEVKAFVGPSDPALVIRMIRENNVEVKRVVYEAGPTGFGLARALAEAGLPVMVVAPSKVVRPVTRSAKTDHLDCIKLADLAAKNMLTGIAIPTEQEESERSLVRRRHTLADNIRLVKQRIKSLLLTLEYKYDFRWSLKSLNALEQAQLPEESKLTLQSYLRELKFLASEKAMVQKMLDRIIEKPEHKKVVACLRSVPGVGVITATTFRMEIFNPERFETHEQVVSLLGLAPTVYHSGAGKVQARTVPTGQKRLRSLLVEAAWTWQARDPRAQALYRRVLGKTGLPQKAIVAVARKLAVILWRLAVTQQPYRLPEAA